MSRIGDIRAVVEANGGKVLHHYANGPGTVGGFSPDGPNKNKVLYKVVVIGILMYNTKMCAELETARSDIERAYICRNGYLKVIFSRRA